MSAKRKGLRSKYLFVAKQEPTFPDCSVFAGDLPTLLSRPFEIVLGFFLLFLYSSEDIAVLLLKLLLEHDILVATGFAASLLIQLFPPTFLKPSNRGGDNFRFRHCR